MMQLTAAWALAKAWAIPLLIAGAAALFGLYSYQLYSLGYERADAKWEAKVKKEKEDQEKIVRETIEEAFRIIDRLNTELEKRNAKIAELEGEADKDTDAKRAALPRRNVLRINRGRAR